jgi:crotonobetainyl-CoA:carnitine CoA-transferase CaiB-like acyl-CoA transferase
MMVKVGDPEAGELFVPGLTVKFSEAKGALGPVPLAGEQTDEILLNLLKYDETRVAELRRNNVV